MKGGMSKFILSREDGEKIVIKLPWGSKLLDYLKGKLGYGDLL